MKPAWLVTWVLIGWALGSSVAAAQRAVLYEEDPGDPQGRLLVGSTTWRTESVSGGTPDLVIRADVAIPDRGITMTFSLRRETDRALISSHTFEMAFKLPNDFPFGGVSNVPGVLMKVDERTRGTALDALAVKSAPGVFLIGLSPGKADVERNLQLLKERSWFDVPIVYDNGRRAILTLEKGDEGVRAFDQAFKAWGPPSAIAMPRDAASSHRAVLYEEDPADPQGRRLYGSVSWRTEAVASGSAHEPVVRADLQIPDRRMTMTFSLRRNTDRALPATHTIELAFQLPADSQRAIAKMPGILMKGAEQTRGAPLAGVAVEVMSGVFLVGLSSVEADAQRNLQLLKERTWFDVPIIYAGGLRAILAIEKGESGQRAFDEAFMAWGR